MARDHLAAALAYARTLGAAYADLRWKDVQTEEIVTENGVLTVLDQQRSQGVGVRVLLDGAVGFAAGPLPDWEATVQRAMETAQAVCQSGSRRPVFFAPKAAAVATYATPVAADPFAVSREEKRTLLADCDRSFAVAGVTHYESRLSFRREDVHFMDTDGSDVSQQFTQSGGSVTAYAAGETGTARRSAHILQRAGWEVLAPLPQKAAKAAQELALLARAPECPGGVYDVILMPNQLHLQLHESMGHPTELDRVLGSEAALAGESYLTPQSRGTRVASAHVTIVADAATHEGGLGTFAYDDEGVPAQAVTLVQNGVLVGFQTDRTSAGALGEASGGMGLADGWQHLPLVRMTNVNLAPGGFTLEALIGGIRHGFMLDQNKSWSIDDKRLHFQFACEAAWEICDGRLTGRVFKNPLYRGVTPDFWQSCDGVCSAAYREVVGIPNCGKGQPLQMARVGHASQPARFRGVQMGGAGPAAAETNP